MSRQLSNILISPSVMMSYGILFYIMVLLFAPIKIVYPVSINAFILLLCCFFAFYIGCFLIRPIKTASQDIVRGLMAPTGNAPYWWLIALGFAGILLRLYDRFFIRGISLSQSAVERKELVEAAGSNIYSLLSSFLFPIGLSLIYYVLRDKPKSKTIWALAIILACYPAFDVILTGNRGLMLTSASLMGLYLIYLGYVKFNLRNLVLAGAAIILLLSISTSVFLARIDQYGFDGYHSVYNSNYAFTMIPNQQAGQILYEDGVGAPVMFTAINFSQYFLHGINEFSYLVDHFDGYGYQQGRFTFGILYKFIAMTTGNDVGIVDLVTMTPRFAVYTTLFGPLYVDFGLGVLIFSLLFGMVSKFLWRRLSKGRDTLAPLYFYFCVVIFFSPVVNLIQNALGIYVLASMLMVALLVWVRGNHWTFTAKKYSVA